MCHHHLTRLLLLSWLSASTTQNLCTDCNKRSSQYSGGRDRRIQYGDAPWRKWNAAKANHHPSTSASHIHTHTHTAHACIDPYVYKCTKPSFLSGFESNEHFTFVCTVTPFSNRKYQAKKKEILYLYAKSMLMLLLMPAAYLAHPSPSGSIFFLATSRPLCCCCCCCLTDIGARRILPSQRTDGITRKNAD